MMMVKNSVVVALVSMLVSQGAVGAVPNPADGTTVSYARPGQVGPAKEPVPKKQIVVENKSSKPSVGGATDAIAPAGEEAGASGEGSLDDLDEPKTKASRASKVYTKPEDESEPASGDGSLEEDDNSPAPPTKPTSNDGDSGDDDLSGSDDIEIPDDEKDGFNWGNEPAPEGAVNSPTTDADKSDDKDAADENKGDGEKGDDDDSDSDSDSDSDDEGDYDEETGEYKKPSVVTEPPTKSADPYTESSSAAPLTESSSIALSTESDSYGRPSSSAEASSSSAASSSAVPSGDGDLGYKRPESSTPGAAKETDTPSGDGGSEDKLKYKRPETPAPEGDGKKDDKEEKSEGYLDMFKNWYNKNYGSKSTAASS